MAHNILKTWWVDILDVTEALQAHDTFAAAGGFDNWRKIFADNATEMATLFSDAFSSKFPPSKGNEPATGYDLLSLQMLFSSVTKADFQEHYRSYGKGVFAPWTNWFLGDWDNGTSRTTQYHIWDNTIATAGRYIQPVTQSETGYAYSTKPGGEYLEVTNGNIAGTLQKLKKAGKADVAVDVLSDEYGITGWVTKLQQSPVIELGHIGYLIDTTNLIWIAQDTAKKDSQDWMIFYERGNRTSRASLYQVDGVSVSYNHAGSVGNRFTLTKSGNGFIRFTCQKPYGATTEANGASSQTFNPCD